MQIDHQEEEPLILRTYLEYIDGLFPGEGAIDGADTKNVLGRLRDDLRINSTCTIRLCYPLPSCAIYQIFDEQGRLLTELRMRVMVGHEGKENKAFWLREEEVQYWITQWELGGHTVQRFIPPHKLLEELGIDK